MGNSRYHHWITDQWQKQLQTMLTSATEKARSHIQERLASAVVVSPEEMIEGRVQFGSLVTVFGIEEEEEQSFQIVSRDHSKTGPGLLDESSPLAQALFGAIEGDTVNVILPNGSNSLYEVTHIRIPQ